MISIKLKNNAYFNLNEKSGRWNFSPQPKKTILQNKSPIILREWDNKIRTLIINVTDKCNLDCVYCSRQQARKKPDEMSEQLIKRILEESIRYSVRKKIKLTIQFHGGEPLIEFDKIISAFDKIKNKNKKILNIRIQTNGTLLNKKILEECQRRGIEIGISLDGREIENDITRKDNLGQGTFSKIKKSLELIKKYQKKVHCLTVVTNINVENLEMILKYFSELGINEIGFLPLYEEPRTKTIKKKIIPNMKKLSKYQKRLFDKWIELLKDKKYKELNISTFQILIWNILSSNSPVKKFRTNCGVGVNSLFIESDGSIWGCGAFSYADKLKIGNIKIDSLDGIQKGKSYKQFSNRITPNIRKCKNCAFQFICKGGCIANGLRTKNSIYGIDVWCEYWEKIIKHILLRLYEHPEIIKLIPEYNITKK